MDAFIQSLPGVAGAVVAGGLIGFEREWRGRAAGFRTHILVCLASALLMQAAVTQADWAFPLLPADNIMTDPTRMAHGVLTGIGFLCAGVIFRTGFSIHGLTTAASLWITAAIGLLFGTGLIGLAALGTAVTVGILVGLRLVNHSLPSKSVVDVEVGWPRDEPHAEAAVEALLRAVDDRLQADVIELVEDGRRVRRTWRIKIVRETEVAALAARLRAAPGVTAFRLDPRNE